MISQRFYIIIQYAKCFFRYFTIIEDILYSDRTDQIVASDNERYHIIKAGFFSKHQRNQQQYYVGGQREGYDESDYPQIILFRWRNFAYRIYDCKDYRDDEIKILHSVPYLWIIGR